MLRMSFIEMLLAARECCLNESRAGMGARTGFVAWFLSIPTDVDLAGPT